MLTGKPSIVMPQSASRRWMCTTLKCQICSHAGFTYWSAAKTRAQAEWFFGRPRSSRAPSFREAIISPGTSGRSDTCSRTWFMATGSYHARDSRFHQSPAQQRKPRARVRVHAALSTSQVSACQPSGVGVSGVVVLTAILALHGGTDVVRHRCQAALLTRARFVDTAIGLLGLTYSQRTPNPLSSTGTGRRPRGRSGRDSTRGCPAGP